MIQVNKPEERLITNITGEPYQPARIYYQVSNKKTVLGVFKKLKCMDYDSSRDRWYWLYTAESQKIIFDESYNKIPKEMQPIALGYFIFRSDEEMILEVRSFQRVIEAIKFFNKRINWRAAEPMRLRLVNKLFSTLEDETPTPPKSFDEFFDNKNVFIQSIEALELELMEVESNYDNDEDKEKAVIEYMEEKSKYPLPEIEEIGLNIHGDGISLLEMALKMKNIEALEHWKGNANFTQYDLIQQMLASMPDDIPNLEEQ
ncbi:hypothetical protein [Aphanothece sacrum]|uniref:Uncharacterized protein n=1 Tax=Aphanothece sacrum FPU1 TaxID=1920663 RepID=A0A401IM85_APHSA|nr:hypothetical protein [Aphanothece sacrum]GBF82338.1 hypothetical protein AsFPU1_3766 [Aphanothece sacrum FPU1]GBF84238.1 hypothetical protein AsFPU3_1285 [Aphanothece sacrum FPU3]